MAIIGAQPFNAFISGRQARQTEDYNNTRNALSQFELSQAPVQAENQNKLAQLQITGAQQGIDQRAAQFTDAQRKDALTQALSAAQQITQNPSLLSAMPEKFKAKAMQDLGPNAQNPEAIKQWGQMMAGNIMAQLGTQPSAPESYTLKPGEARFQGATQVAALPDNPNAADKGFSLSPGQIRYDANGRQIAAAPAKPTSTDLANIEGNLRQEFTKQAQPFLGVAESYQRIRDSVADPSAAGDLALIFNYMKVLDPGSTVREGEFATAQNAGSIPSQIVARYNKVISGERLAPEQRADFFSRATKLYQGQEKRFNTLVKDRYTKLAQKQGVDPANVVIDVTAPTEVPANAQPSQQPGAPITVNSPEEAMRLPSGTRFRTPDGREKVRP